jgi:hypothetical protein
MSEFEMIMRGFSEEQKQAERQRQEEQGRQFLEGLTEEGKEYKRQTAKK